MSEIYRITIPTLAGAAMLIRQYTSIMICKAFTIVIIWPKTPLRASIAKKCSTKYAFIEKFTTYAIVIADCKTEDFIAWVGMLVV